MSLDQIAFVTGSRAKLLEAERILGMGLERVDLDLPEVQEVDVAPVVEAKAREAYARLGGRTVLVEDTGLALQAWNGLPGALVKWFLKRMGPAGICGLADAFSDRTAVATCVAAVFDGSQVRIFPGIVQGRIALLPAGSGGFGWDPCFIPDGSTRTFAEMEPGEKDRYSMRRIAFQAAATALRPAGPR